MSKLQTPRILAAPGISPRAAMSRIVRSASASRETAPAILQRFLSTVLLIAAPERGRNGGDDMRNIPHSPAARA
jgi:hypothetical protein